MKLYALIVVLFAAAVVSPSAIGRSAPAEPPSADATGGGTDPLPEPVRRAADQGRYWRASELMRAHLATVADTTPAALLATARLSAGWGDWGSVASLLEGREWLDSVERGAGLELLGRSRIALGRSADGAEALAGYLDLPGPTDRERGVAELRRGLALDDAGDIDAALVAFDRAGRLLPWLEDWAGLFAARAAAGSGDTAVVRTRLATAGSLATAEGWRIRLEALREAGDSLGARELALETATSGATAGTRASGWAELARLRLAAGDTARARAAFVEATGIPGAMAAVEAARALSDLRPTPEEWRRIAAIYARHGNAQRAVDGYAKYLAAGIGTAAERRDARLELARARFNAGSYARAERDLLELASGSVPARIGAEALYLAGRAQYRQGRSQDGQRTLATLPERFPGEEAVARGLYLLADLKHDDQELDDARRYYRQAAEASPAVNEAGLALMRLGGLHMLDSDYEGAVAVFEEYRRLHPDGRRWGQSTYWAAQAHAALGREEEARARLRELRQKDPLSYYGVRAAERLEVPVLDVAMGPAPAADPALAERVDQGLRRVDVLAELGRQDDLVREVERLRDGLNGQEPGEYDLAEALNERGHTLTAIGMGWDIFRRNRTWNDRLLRIIYPFPFRELILHEAGERGLDPFLVAGLIRRESAFSPTVISGAGAIGLMQVMPETGRALAREAGLREYDPALLKEPDINVHLGSRYLRTMLDRYDRDLPLTLSAYNAGPTRAARWRELPEARDPELFSERVPYSETRDYIRHVVLHRALYTALYPEIEAPAP